MGISAVSQPAVTPTITAGAYSANDALGGLMEFADAVNEHSRSGIITNLLIVDKAGQSTAIDVFLFDATFTATADNAAWPTTNPTETVIGTNCVGVITVEATDYKTYNGGSLASVELTKPIKVSGTTVYAQAVVRGTPTYVATTDLIFRLSIAKD